MCYIDVVISGWLSLLSIFLHIFWLYHFSHHLYFIILLLCFALLMSSLFSSFYLYLFSWYAIFYVFVIASSFPYIFTFPHRAVAIIFFVARWRVSIVVVTVCAAHLSATVTFPCLILFSLFAFCFLNTISCVTSYLSLVSRIQHSVFRFIFVSQSDPGIRATRLVLSPLTSDRQRIVYLKSRAIGRHRIHQPTTKQHNPINNPLPPHTRTPPKKTPTQPH